MSENAPREPADANRPRATVEFGSDSQLIDVDESEMTQEGIPEAVWLYLEKKYGRRRKLPPEAPPPADPK
jgi:hypothetical protein